MEVFERWLRNWWNAACTRCSPVEANTLEPVAALAAALGVLEQEQGAWVDALLVGLVQAVVRKRHADQAWLASYRNRTSQTVPS